MTDSENRSDDNRGEAPALPAFDLKNQPSVPFDGRFLSPGNLAESPNPRMSLLDAVHTRRTSRAYADRPVDRATLEWLVGNAMHAPTACNEQQWKIIQIDDADVIEDLYERGSAAFLQGVRQCVLVCYNRDSDNRAWADGVQSGAAFVTLFQLLAHSIGIGSCWICHLPNKSELRRLFDIHRAYEPVALVSYGYYRNKVKTHPRKHEPGRVIMESRFRAEGLVFSGTRRVLWRTIGRYLYYKIPPFLRRRLRPYTTPFEKKFYYETFD
ncbi:MAG: nitroreductase family protein [Rhodospirillales bacterium]|jgi:nitroreductase|nr:nitroreductase family protein [Rhodospirillales bacterium]